MDYPNNFDIKSFPAGKTIAFSRSVSVWISVIFVLIIALCGFILLGMRLKTNYPFLISVDPFTKEWTVVTYPGKDKKESVPQYQIIQEKLVRDFTVNWFSISNQDYINEERWAECDQEDCNADEQFKPDNINCAIYCKSDENVFEEFTEKVVPEYRARVQASENWTVGPLLITPTSISETSGVWQVFATIDSTVNSSFKVLSFITIKQNQDAYPATLGYYVTKFNSYRIPNE